MTVMRHGFRASKNRPRTVLRALLAICSVFPLRALDGPLALTQLEHVARLDHEQHTPIGQVTAIARTIWAAVASGGLLRIRPGVSGDFDGLQAISISEDKQGGLLLGTGEAILRIQDGRTSVFASHAGKTPMLPGLLLKDRDQAIWIGTTAQGLPFDTKSLYQSRFFVITCIAAFVALLAVAYRIQIRLRFGLVIEERARIARELHDTVLQGFTGVTYQLAAIYRQLKSHPGTSTESLLRIMDLAEQSVAEARQAISLLRLDGLEGKTLAEAIALAGQNLTANTDVKFSSTHCGMGRKLSYDVKASVYMAACEAIRNATKHANPAKISSDLSLTLRGLKLVIVDDGEGFDLQAAGSSTNHFGIRGMQERIRSVGGTLSVLTMPGKGTCVEILVPRYRLFLFLLADDSRRRKSGFSGRHLC